MIQVKNQPIGVDAKINDFQIYLYTNLPFANYGSFPRVYKNPKGRLLVPETYTKDKDYQEVFFDDNRDITSFFVVSDEREVLEGDLMRTTVSFIVQADIMALFPAVEHRADEELNNLILDTASNFGGSQQFRLVDIVTGVDNVYSEFDRSDVRLDDMSEKYVVRFDFDVTYSATCCSDCLPLVKVCPDFVYNIKDTDGNVLYNGSILSGGALSQVIQNSLVTNSEGTVIADLLSQENIILADVDNIDSNGLVVTTPMGVPFTCTPIPPCDDANLTLNLSPFLTVSSGSDTNIVLKDQTGTEITPLSVVGNEIEVDIPSDSMHLTTATTTNTNIQIRTINGVQYQVDWGDGSITTHNSDTVANKTYASPYAGVIKVWAVSGGLINIDKLQITAGNWNFDISTLKYYVPNLTTLYLQGNLFTGDMSGVTNLTSLTYLRLQGNSFTGDMSGVTNLTSLTTLYLQGNLFTGDMSGVTNLTSLTLLLLSGNYFTGDMSNVDNLTSLTYLTLFGNFTINYTSTTFAPNFQRWFFRPTTATNPMSSLEIDQLLADAAQTTWTGTKAIYVDGNNGVRTSASDAEVATLQVMGVTLFLNV